ncbi:triosephosphate isomerase [[Emmonsia] crescens]|uniref:Triosephosphate isomerase n=1 Tax=[Emmonsia] crescens TaxID=73230 RepID=A0A0G2I147_9EURO|nr:triosephosphate isomerase [Emmonsia crescens UAMH 3008]
MATRPAYPLLPKTLLIISLKMYFTPSRTITYLRDLLDPQNEILRSENSSKLLLALIPDFLTIYPCSEILQQQNQQSPSFLLGAQDCFWESLGPYTGEISPSCLQSLRVSLVELGHAERRAIFHETNEQVGRKAAAVSAHGMVPLICVGEISAPGISMADSVHNAVSECMVQVQAVLDVVSSYAPLIFAYEPVWAIGKPVPASVKHVAGVVKGIRGVISGTEREGDVRILYGGSAGPGLWGEGGLGKVVDGMFLGRFAHEIEGVRKVVREVEETL